MTAQLCATCSASVPVGRFCAACGAPLQAPAAFVPAQHVPAAAVPAVAVPLGAVAAPAATPAPAPAPWAPGAGDVLPPPVPLFPPAPSTPLPGGIPAVFAPTGRSRNDARSTGAVALTAAALAVGAWFLFGDGADKRMTGDLELTDGVSGLEAGDLCSGRGGYDDIQAGAQITLQDGEGTTLATTELGQGVYDGQACVFRFALEGVEKSEFYVLEMGNVLRGEQSYAHEELVDQDWTVHLTLGDD